MVCGGEMDGSSHVFHPNPLHLIFIKWAPLFLVLDSKGDWDGDGEGAWTVDKCGERVRCRVGSESQDGEEPWRMIFEGSTPQHKNVMVAF